MVYWVRKVNFGVVSCLEARCPVQYTGNACGKLLRWGPFDGGAEVAIRALTDK